MLRWCARAAWLAFGAILVWMAGCKPRPAEVVVCSQVAEVAPDVIARLNGGTRPDAVTIAGTTFYLANADDPRLRAHEKCHRDQMERMGPNFYRVYLEEHHAKGYDGNALEAECRAAEGSP